VTCGFARLFRSCAPWLLIALAACRARAPEPQRAAAGDCANVQTLRVCWDGAGPHAAARATGGAARAPGPTFACSGDRCEQRHPRMPDDGEWQCADSAGATVCMGGERAAGVARPAAEPAWFCGARRDRVMGARICVDLSPDFPDGRAPGWRCRTLYEGPTRRVCDRDPAAHTLAETCDRAHPCVDGSRCAGGWCVPERPAPECWLDTDCAAGRCRFGSCVGGA